MLIYYVYQILMMRQYPLFVMVALLMMQAVAAVSLQVPDEVSDGRLTVDVGDVQMIDFTIKSDNKGHDVVFFAYADPEGYVEVDGKQRVEEAFHLNPYEIETFPLDIEAVDNPDGDAIFHWGVTIDGDDSDFGISNQIADDFTIRIRGDATGDAGSTSTDVDVDVSAPLDGQGKPSGGVGGSTALMQNSQSSTPSDGDSSAADGNIGDVTGSDSSLSEARVNTGNAGTSPTKPSVKTSIGNIKGGKSVALLFIGLLLLSMILQMSAIKVYKGVHDAR